MGAFIFRTFLLIISASFIHQVSGKSNYTDDETPYEFGFVIEGEQHRHEKKDVKGIIEGEFGFITADGVYHVTVYATDENGNFRIISMKNTRVSGPLDGDYKKKPVPGVSSGPAQQRQGKSERLTLPNKPSVESSTGGPFVKYSTKPTLKPGCGGCGYVTTKKPKPGQKFPVLQPLDKPKPSKYTSAGTPGSPNESADPKPGTGTDRNVEDALIDPRYDEKRPGSVPTNRPGVSVNNRFGQGQPASPNRPYKVNERITQFQKEVSNDIQDLEGKVQNLRNPKLSAAYKAGTNPPLPDDYESPVKVNNGIITVPGSPDIRIQDKYPGMQDGLPPGMKESDITDLLYKFNYTLGFHGHYERGYKNGAKIGGYFVNGRDGISRIVTYVADENGFRPRVKFVRLGLEDERTPKEGTEKSFGLINFEFVWYPVE